MGLFDSVTKEHILASIKQIDESGIPPTRFSRHYDLLYQDRRYPPKYLLSIASGLATGRQETNFPGGKGTDAFRRLEQLGFEIVNKSSVFEGVEVWKANCLLDDK